MLTYVNESGNMFKGREEYICILKKDIRLFWSG